MARDSRAPGFDMTYRPTAARSFGPPWKSWVLPGTYFLLSVVLLAVVAMAHLSQQESWLFRYVVEGDVHRFVSSRVLALIFFAGGVAVLIRTSMRGVVIHPDGIEARYLGPLGWPKVRNCTWAEIDEFLFEKHAVGIGLWDGDRMWLPPVGNDGVMREALQKVAYARAIPMKGPAAPGPDEDPDGVERS